MAGKKKRPYKYSGGPHNKYTRHNRARSLTDTSSVEPTVEPFSDIQNSDDLIRPSEEKKASDQIRPSKRSFDLSQYRGEIVGGFITAAIFAIGGYLIYDNIELSAAKKDIEIHSKSIEDNKSSINEIEKAQVKTNADINNINSDVKLLNYKVGAAEVKLDGKVDKPKK